MGSGTSRALRATAITCVTAFVLSAASCPPDDTSRPRETRISILQLNMRGINDVPNGDRNGYWETRFARIATDLGAGNFAPDIIALQEVAGRVWCPDNPNFILDYEPLYHLLRELHRGTGIRYRIANYQTFARERRVGWTGPTVMGGVIPECRATSGMAMLYNPVRIYNPYVESTAAVVDASASFNTDSTTGTLRRSMPCCAGRVRPGTEGVCELIDGPAQSHVCSSAAGLAKQVEADVVVGRFEIFGRRDSRFHVYNVHLPWRSSSAYATATGAARAIIDAEEAGVTRWIAPIIVGDFNEPGDVVREWAPDFDLIDYAPLDNIIQLFVGNATTYGSKAKIAHAQSNPMPATATSAGCVDPGVLWSDHCGLLTTLTVQEP